jgi:hypothetical protein
MCWNCGIIFVKKIMYSKLWRNEWFSLNVMPLEVRYNMLQYVHPIWNYLTTTNFIEEEQSKWNQNGILLNAIDTQSQMNVASDLKMQEYDHWFEGLKSMIYAVKQMCEHILPLLIKDFTEETMTQTHNIVVDYVKFVFGTLASVTKTLADCSDSLCFVQSCFVKESQTELEEMVTQLRQSVHLFVHHLLDGEFMPEKANLSNGAEVWRQRTRYRSLTKPIFVSLTSQLATQWRYISNISGVNQTKTILSLWVTVSSEAIAHMFASDKDNVSMLYHSEITCMQFAASVLECIGFINHWFV